MFRKNQSHRQPPLLSPVQTLTEQQRLRLESSWAGVFYHEFFSRLDESSYAVLYSDKVSRPNVPVNVLVSLEFLKAGHGWSDEEMYDQFQFNLQVRYALGLHEFNTGNFELRSVYNFRRRLSAYHQETGVDLLAHSFASVTDAQLAVYGIRTAQQRMDSSQISSDIANASRLQLVLTGVQRLMGLLDEAQQAQFAELLAPYQQGRAMQLAYRVRGREATDAALLAAGEVLATLLPLLNSQTRPEQAATTTATVTRLFGENFHLTEAQGVVVKGNDEITSGALQSLDDLEATFRRKGGDAYKGYVVNVAETCDPQNELQLITHVQVASNNTDDATLLCQSLPTLCQRTDLTDLYTDGGFGSPEADLLLHDLDVALHQTHLRGKAPAPDRYCLADFDITLDEHKEPVSLGCPHGQVGSVSPARSTGFIAQFDAQICLACPAFAATCRVCLLKQSSVCHLSFTRAELLWALRRQRHRQLRQRADNPRAAVEATIRSIKHPNNGRLPVRGLRRVTDMLIGAAAMANLRSILRFQHRKRKQELAQQAQPGPKKGWTRVKQGLESAQAFFSSLCRWGRPQAFAT